MSGEIQLCGYCPAPSKYEAGAADGPFASACGRHAARMLEDVLGKTGGWYPVKVDRTNTPDEDPNDEHTG